MSEPRTTQRWRLFIAHPVPLPIRQELARQLAPYRERHLQVRWTRPASWHLTLLFLGSVEADRVAELRALTDDVAAVTSPYDVRVAQGGGRLQRNEGVAWLGLGRGAGTLIEIADMIAARCPEDVTVGARPKRTPSPHLTVVRRADAATIKNLRSQALGALGVDWLIDRIELVRSHLEPGGARYETLHVATL